MCLHTLARYVVLAHKQMLIYDLEGLCKILKLQRMFLAAQNIKFNIGIFEGLSVRIQYICLCTTADINSKSIASTSCSDVKSLAQRLPAWALIIGHKYNYIQ